MSGTLIDELLKKQQILTPVAKFARSRSAMNRVGRHRDLIPLTAPGRGEQYAFEVNLDQCTGCKACVAACHNLNGLEESETWREVGMLLGKSGRKAVQRTVTSACHHCAEPGCLEGCPVLAYEKDEINGIVRHLDDQCIGCQYCVMKCPYEVPKYSKRLGIVRKCDMCHGRLAAGEAPACVQACPTSAITIRTVKLEDVRARAAALEFLPDSPDPRITKPTTRYVSSNPVPGNLQAADHFAPVVQHAHGPLAAMLVLTQAGLGLLIGSGGEKIHLTFACGFVVLGLICSVLHLGQPLRAWRCFLGWRRSWLSREILLLGAFAKALIVLTVATWFGLNKTLLDIGLWGTVLLGLGGVACSAWVYHDTHRAVWKGMRSFGRFFWTTCVFIAPPLLPLVLGGKLSWETSLVRASHRPDQDSLDPMTDLEANASLLNNQLGVWWRSRIALALIGMAIAIFNPLMGLAIALLGELLERSLFFRSGFARKMPGPGR